MITVSQYMSKAKTYNTTLIPILSTTTTHWRCRNNQSGALDHKVHDAKKSNANRNLAE